MNYSSLDSSCREESNGGKIISLASIGLIYKFAHPRLDLLCFIIIGKVVPQQLDCCNERELPLNYHHGDFKTAENI